MAISTGVEFYSAFRFTVGGDREEIGVLRVDVGPTADSLRIWRGIAKERQPMFAELFDEKSRSLGARGVYKFQIALFDRDEENRRVYYYECDEVEMIPVVRLDAIDSGVALEGLELRGVKLCRVLE